MTQPPERLPALRLLLPPRSQRIVEAHAHRRAGIFFRQRAHGAPQILELFGLGAASFAGTQVNPELSSGILVQGASPVIDELCSGVFAVHDAFSPASSK